MDLRSDMLDCSADVLFDRGWCQRSFSKAGEEGEEGRLLSVNEVDDACGDLPQSMAKTSQARKWVR